VKNKVWDQIKLIDSSFSDLMRHQRAAGVRHDDGGSFYAGRRPRPAPVHRASGRYSFQDQQGILRQSQLVHKIFNANRNVLTDPKLTDPNKISPGQGLLIPE
jgi:hypothetical protein